MTDERFPNWLIDVEKGTIYSLRLSRYIGAINENGYVQVSKQKGYKHCKLHQYIWMTANGCDIPEGYDVHHIDGNKLNNSIYNLELKEKGEHIREHKIGKQRSEETKKKISEHKIGTHHSEETKKKISESHKGKIFSEETKKKISESHKGVYNNPKNSKQVAQYTLDGELVKIWLSANECGRNGFNQAHVADCCRGERKTHKGFIWRYIEEKGVA